jgi:DNA primase
MFPIRDRRGRTIGFGGRILGDAKPKYLNSPETPLFHKGRELYGLFEAHQALRQIRRLLVVEGYLDVIALAQHGLPGAVATLGTATTADHLERLFRTTREVTFCFDGDRAGRDAAWKALNAALPAAREGREIRFLFLPEGEDPDTLVRSRGRDDFERRLGDAQHLSGFLFERLAADLDMHSLDGRAHLADRARPLLKQLPAGLYRDMMTAHLARLVGLTPRQLDLQESPARVRRPARPGMPERLPPLRRAIALLLQYPAIATRAGEAGDDWKQLAGPGIQVLCRMLELTQMQPTLSTATLIERWRDTEYFAQLSRLAHQPLVADGADPGHEFVGTLVLLNREARDRQGQPLLSRARPSQLSEAEKEQLRKLLERAPANGSADPQVDH